MKNVRVRQLLAFTVIMIMSWALFSIIVHGGQDWYLINDSGNEASKWTMKNDEIYSTNSLSDGPSSGNGGSFYYFRDTSDDGDKRHVADAQVERSVSLTGDYKTLSDLGQLSVNFSIDYYGYSNDSDWFRVYLYALNSSNQWVTLWGSGAYTGVESWKSLRKYDIPLPAYTKAIKIDIYADRKDGKDLDVYLDNIKLWISDEKPPYMTEAAVTGIKDYYGNMVPLKKDGVTGEYLDNWVNSSDNIYFTVKYNEPVTASADNTLFTNLLNSNGAPYNKNFTMDTASKDSHDFSIFLANANRLKDGDNYIQFLYNPDPFFYPMHDLGGNTATYTVKPNIEKYKLRIDSVVPDIISPKYPWDCYEVYERDRTSVDIVVREENRGTPQSPLTLTYHWDCKDAGGIKVIGPEKELIISNTVEPVADEIYTTYNVKIDIPNGSNIPPYQEFTLYAEAVDEARNGQGNARVFFDVNQKDATPPTIIWDKSVHEDGTIIDLSKYEDEQYTTSRAVSFYAEDLDSGIEEVKYLWTREPYKAGVDIINKVALREADGKYHIEGTKKDTPLEGVYYLTILAVNGTETESISSKAFYFDNEGPRVRDKIEYIDGKPDSAQYQLEDEALLDKFLYTILIMNESTWTYEPVTEPDISEDIKDDGMWKALKLDNAEKTASITGVFDEISETGYYKLVARFYDKYYNCTQIEHQISFDFTPPTMKIHGLGEPGVFKKRHEVTLDYLPDYTFPGIVIEILDNSHVEIWGDGFSANWVDIVSREKIPASLDIWQGWIIIKGSEDLSGSCYLNGRYNLNVWAKDFVGNVMDKTVSLDGNAVVFCFDNSPPTVDITYDKTARNVFKFSYSELKDAYTEVEVFKYGISDSPVNEPTEWIEVAYNLDEGEITHPTTDGAWYLHIMLKDTLGNEQIISLQEPFLIDTTKPSGSISYGSGYTNKLGAPLQIRIDELKTISNKTFKTILSKDRAKLEDAAIAEALPTDWKDITYENGLAIYNWELSDIADGEQQVFTRFMDEAGNMSDIYEASITLDRTPPMGEVIYDISLPTSNSVSATLSMDDNYSDVTLLNNGGSGTYAFNRNGEFEFIIMDAAGNKARVKAVVDNIDKDPPKAYITYSHPRDIWTNESITATLHLEDINGYTVLSEGELTHTFDKNGEFLFEFEDKLGNQGSIKAEVRNIDKEAPVGSIIYVEGDTSPITVYLDANEAVRVTNNGGSFRYMFYENGDFTFEFEDKAGNTGTAMASIYTITSPENYLNVMYGDSGELTNKNIAVEFTPDPALACITSPTVERDSFDTYEYSFNDNGDHSVSIRVLSEEGDTRTVTGSVYNIDRTPPEAIVYLSTIDLTNQDVIATLLTYDDRGTDITILNNGGESEYVFEENGSFTFEFMDGAGNIGYKQITVSNIDKEAPIPEIRYFTKESKPNSKFAQISFKGEAGEVEIMNNNGSDIFEFMENGSFTFLYSDKAGNKGEAIVRVDNLSDSISVGTIEYYIGETKIDDPDEMMINESVIAKLILDEAYTIVNNGGNSSYTFLQNGEFTFVYEDGNSNRGFTTAKVSTIDKEAPKLQILADIARPTKENIIITVNYSDNVEIKEVIHNMDLEDIIPSEAGLTYICSDNKTIEVTVIDTAGNKTTKLYDVNYIDREKPTAEIIYTPSSFTNKNVRAVLIPTEPVKILTNSGKAEYIFTQNGEFVFEFEDQAGNKGSKTAEVNWIDKIPPRVSLEYSNNVMTNKPVEVILYTDEDTIILNNGGSANRTFYRNGEFTFRVRDEAGNIAEIKAEVKNIDADKPEITLKGLSYVTLFKDEAYIDVGYTAVDNIDGDLTAQVIVEGNVDTAVSGIYILKYKVSDAVGNSSEEMRTVKVSSPGELVLLLNDEVVEGESVILNKKDVKVNALGNEGSLTIKWAKGKRTQAYFKTGGNIVAPGGTVKLEGYNWYTFFVQDRERRIKIIQVYVNE